MSDKEPEAITPEAEPVILPEPAEDPVVEADAPAAPVEKRNTGLLGGLLGGLIAAVLGFGLAHYVPKGWPLQDTAALQSALAAQQAETADLQAKLASLPDTGGLSAQVADLTARVKALEARPAGDAAAAAALQAMQAQIDALKQAPAATVDPAAVQAVMAEAQAAADKLKAEAEATSALASNKLALAQVQAALDSGAPYAAALAGLADVPAVLSDHAKTGLPTLASLTTAFPVAARAALEASLRADMGQSWADRAANFLRSQTGARSTTPRAGSDPDAVLSRAEAALRANDLATALTEIAALPAPAQAEMAAWQALAQTRLAGETAVAGLAAALGQ